MLVLRLSLSLFSARVAHFFFGSFCTRPALVLVTIRPSVLDEAGLPTVHQVSSLHRVDRLQHSKEYLASRRTNVPHTKDKFVIMYNCAYFSSALLSYHDMTMT